MQHTCVRCHKEIQLRIFLVFSCEDFIGDTILENKYKHQMLFNTELEL